MFLDGEMIEQWLSDASKRDAIAYGMRQRSLLEAATNGVWGQMADPREYNGIPILGKRAISATDTNQRIHVPFDKMISTNKVGYFASDIQVVLGPQIPQVVKDFYQSLRDVAKWKSLMMGLADACVTQGAGYLLVYLNDDGAFSLMQSPTCNTMVIRDSAGNPEYGVRYSGDDIEVYDGLDVTSFVRDERGLLVAGESVPHGLGTVNRPMVPIIEFRNAPDSIGNPERTIGLQDAYDLSISDLADELSAVRMSYLLLKGLGTKAKKVKEDLKDAGVIILDSDNADARFVSKNLNPQAIQLLQETTRELIFEGASSYDPESKMSGDAPTAFEVSQRLHGLKMDTEITMGEWDAGFRQFDYLIKTYLETFSSVVDYPLWEVNRIYRLVSPSNILGSLVEAKNAGVVLSNKTLIEQSGLQIDAEEEEKRIKDEGLMVANSGNNGI